MAAIVMADLPVRGGNLVCLPKREEIQFRTGQQEYQPAISGFLKGWWLCSTKKDLSQRYSRVFSSDAYRIPIRITTQILYQLTELHIIIEVNYGDDERVVHYQPAIDVNKITVSYLLTRMDEYGSENFKIDTSKLFSKEWKALLKTREDMIKANDNILLKDL